ncbi:unnamed protein product [Adineta steineri]|uniref:Uncharacterized protein n=1 Tax=Adineta steineri TaxID=433720 RepID=A0A814PBC0_9BILA|nr:unnamed protein product [Adineta steineri]CAF1103811.1 unnamed protein product [Adineta steineri]
MCDSIIVGKINNSIMIGTVNRLLLNVTKDECICEMMKINVFLLSGLNYFSTNRSCELFYSNNNSIVIEYNVNSDFIFINQSAISITNKPIITLTTTSTTTSTSSSSTTRTTSSTSSSSTTTSKTTSTSTTSTTTTTTTTTTFIFNSTCSKYYCCTFGPTPCVYNNHACACDNTGVNGPSGNFFCRNCTGQGPSTYYGGGGCYYGGWYYSGC